MIGDPSDSSSGFVLDPKGNLSVLSLPGADNGFQLFNSINNENQIVGYWGPGISYLGIPVPEPSTRVMSAFGLMAVLGVFWRQSRRSKLAQ
jgi:hypothetical protein